MERDADVAITVRGAPRRRANRAVAAGTRGAVMPAMKPWIVALLLAMAGCFGGDDDVPCNANSPCEEIDGPDDVDAIPGTDAPMPIDGPPPDGCRPFDDGGMAAASPLPHC